MNRMLYSFYSNSLDLLFLKVGTNTIITYYLIYLGTWLKYDIMLLAAKLIDTCKRIINDSNLTRKMKQSRLDF